MAAKLGYRMWSVLAFDLSEQFWRHPMVPCARPSVTNHRKPRQARKGATVAVDSGAGDRRVQGTTPFPDFSS